MTTIHSSRDSRSTPSLWLLWFGILAGPTAWATHLSIGYFLVTLDCRYDISPYVVLRDVSALALFVISIFGGVVSYTCFRRLPPTPPDADSPSRAKFMAVAGMLLSTLFSIAIVMGSVPVIFLESCSAH